MCFLCSGAKFSRSILAMLPWLIVTFTFFAAFSQFLPHRYRVEITPTRVFLSTCVLLGFFWTQYLKPRWLEWQAMRKELAFRKARLEAQKVARWRKEATKCCRNCHVAYKDQNPLASGKYMCTSCGHVSKKPEFQVPGELYPRTRKGCGFENRLACWRKSDWWRLVQEELDKQSFSQFIHKCALLLLGLRNWLVKTLVKPESSGNNCASARKTARDSEDMLDRKERAKKKAEEKRQARIDRERREEEERKEREEIRRLVDERSKLRAEMLEAEDLAKRKKEEKEAGAKPKKKVAEKHSVKEKKTIEDSGTNVCEIRKREWKSPDESFKRKDKRHYDDNKSFRVDSNAGYSSLPKTKPTTPWKKSPVSKPPAASASPMAKEVKDATTGTPMTWSSVLSRTFSTSPLTSQRHSPATPTSWKASVAALRVKSLSPEPESRPSSPDDSSAVSPLSSTVSEDPIYFPGTARGLPPISAPHNTEPEASPAFFASPFFQPPVLPPPSVECTLPISTASTSTQLSADAPPFYYTPRAPPQFADPFTGLLMVDPVVGADGYTYERESSEKWLAASDISPITGQPLPSAPAPDTVDRRLWPNHHLRSQITDYYLRRARERVASPEKPLIRGLYTDPMWRFEQTSQ